MRLFARFGLAVAPREVFPSFSKSTEPKRGHPQAQPGLPVPGVHILWRGGSGVLHPTGRNLQRASRGRVGTRRADTCAITPSSVFHSSAPSRGAVALVHGVEQRGRGRSGGPVRQRSSGHHAKRWGGFHVGFSRGAGERRLATDGQQTLRLRALATAR